MIGIEMKMPENCSKCSLEASNIMGTEHACKVTEKRTTGVREAIREEHCPLREIKDEDIEADADQLEAGDEVNCQGDLCVVIWVGGPKIEIMFDDGSAGYREPENLKKTGRHYDEISAVLEKLKEAKNEEK